jgi:hypothetical protein
MDRADNRSHLAAGIGRVDEDVLSEADKRRFLEEVKDNFWVKRDNAWVLSAIEAELDEIDGVSVEKSTEEEDTEVDEEIEIIKRS